MLKKATLGGGCFWCIEACILNLKGVSKVYPGFSGGTLVDPRYSEVCAGNTGHAEVINIDYDESQVAFKYVSFLNITRFF